MRIAIFTELYTPSIGGQEIRYAEMGEALAAAGHEVAIYCIGHSRDLPREEIVNGVHIHRYPLAHNYKAPRVKALRRKILPLLRFAVWCRSIARHNRFDLLIYNQWPLAHVAFAPACARHLALLDWCEVRTGFPYQLAQRFLPRMTNGNMAVSPAVQKHIAAVSGCEVVYIPSGVHCRRYRSRPRNERGSILYLGRITEHKNLSFLITAFEILKQRGYNGELVVAGGGPALTALNERVATSPVAEHISILGPVSEAKKIRLLSTSDLLAIPSRREGFPRVVAEAMASGLPVATADFPENGTTHVVRHYGCGEVSDPVESRFAETMRSLLADWESYSQRALARAPELDWANLNPRIEAIAKSFRGEDS